MVGRSRFDANRGQYPMQEHKHYTKAGMIEMVEAKKDHGRGVKFTLQQGVNNPLQNTGGD